MRVILLTAILGFSLNSVSATKAHLKRFTKVTGTFLNFQGGQRSDTGISYASQDLRIEEHEIFIRTYTKAKVIETRFYLQGPDYLSFVAKTNDPMIPEMKGRFLNLDYEECIMAAELPEQKLRINGVLTKQDDMHASSTKTVTNLLSGTVVGVVHEQVELISEEAFNEATVQN